MALKEWYIHPKKKKINFFFSWEAFISSYLNPPLISFLYLPLINLLYQYVLVFCISKTFSIVIGRGL